LHAAAATTKCNSGNGKMHGLAVTKCKVQPPQNAGPAAAKCNVQQQRQN